MQGVCNFKRFGQWQWFYSHLFALNAVESANKYIWCNNWLIDYLLFYVPLKNFSLMWRRHHYRWRAAKFMPMLGAQGLWPGKDLYRATPAETRGLSFSGLIWRTAPFSRLLRHTRGCRGPILTRILTSVMRSIYLRLSRICDSLIYYSLNIDFLFVTLNKDSKLYTLGFLQ
jgi:hypothetical protein